MTAADSHSFFDEQPSAQTEPEPVFAEVILPLALPNNFTWRVPSSFVQALKKGMRVEVMLKNKKYAGIIKRLHHEKPVAFEPRDMLNVLDEEPLVFETQLELWHWMAVYYMCSEGEVMNAALPAHFKLNSESILIFNEEYGDDFSALDHNEYLVAEALLLKKELTMSEVQMILDVAQVYPIVRRLVQKKLCHIWESMKDRYQPKKETYIILHPQYEDEEKLSALFNDWKRAEKQMELLLSYLHIQKTEGLVTKKELLRKSGATDAQLKGLITKNILLAEKRQVNRLVQWPRNIEINFSLSEVQQKALDEIRQHFTDKSVCLLQGVTGSGKTEIYIRLIEEAIRKGQQVLYLLPEIALTTQLIRRLQQFFGGYITVYHSRFSDNERVEIWNQVKTGAATIVVGARSALLMPFQNLGLVIADEEHEPSYKQQEPAPRYHARDTAVYYASLFGAKVLLGSATPSIETWYNAQNGKYALVTLDQRYGGIELPHTVVVDTKPYLKAQPEKIIVTRELKESIEATLAANRQVILFKNRRGYTPYKVCKDCGTIPQCRHCDVSLTYHKSRNQLVCHYCGTLYPPINTCMACGSNRFLQRNFGTERIEEELQEMFPKARVARMDQDSVRGKNAHDQLIQMFEQGRVDILVGTQMVVKGLDFEKVQLVGILDADSMLHYADFRVNERAFQLMEQVSGRAGRKEQQGQVLIQVAQTGHPLLQWVIQHDYRSFAQAEMAMRRQFDYPPFTRLIVLHFRHKEKAVVQQAAQVVANNMQKALGRYITGPAEPVIGRVRNQYLMELLFKLPKDAPTIQLCKQMIAQQMAILQNDRHFRSVVMVPDIDPV
jgi:primosomal protein N' (replication factor Y) (superfamily II helicase)